MKKLILLFIISMSLNIHSQVELKLIPFKKEVQKRSPESDVIIVRHLEEIIVK